METDNLILLYTNQVFPTRFIQFMVPGPKRFREQVQLRQRNSRVGGILEIMPWEERLKELNGFNLKEGRFYETE